MSGEQLHKILLAPETSEHTPDSVLITADCGHKAWIAPTSAAHVANPFTKTGTVCLGCADPVMVAESVRAFGGVPALPGQRDELNRILGVAETDQLWARLRVREIDD